MSLERAKSKYSGLGWSWLNMYFLPAGLFIVLLAGSAFAKEGAILEGFEAGVMPPGGWTVIQNNPNESWNISGGGYSGAYRADILYDDALLDQDEILLSPAFSADSATLSFYSLGSLYWCRDTYDNCDLEVWLVRGEWDGGADDDIYVGKADDDWTATWAWSLSSFPLDALLPTPKAPIRIAFRYKGNDGAEISLDDIELYYINTFPWPMFLPAINSNAQ